MTTESASRLVQLSIPGPVGPLEAVLQERRDGAHAVTAVVCHPHPLYGGTLHNKVVHRAASTLHELGAAVLRFNFRGVGGSAGHYDQGAGELEDARAALAFMRTRHPEARRWLAGFSFGSWIAARLASEEPDIERLLVIAPPFRRSNFEFLHRSRVPKLVIQGRRDDVCPAAVLEAQFPKWAEPKRLVWVEDAGHFFDRRLDALAEAIRTLFAEPLAPAGP